MGESPARQPEDDKKKKRIEARARRERIAMMMEEGTVKKKDLFGKFLPAIARRNSIESGKMASGANRCVKHFILM